MANNDIKIFDSLLKSNSSVRRRVQMAFDDVLLYSLERRHLDLPEFSNVLLQTGMNQESNNVSEHLKRNIRLLKIDEISFDSNEKIHLPGVESALSSMRNRGYSLVFVVHGDVFQTSVYLGISRFAENPSEINAAVDSYASAWQANFAGSKFKKLSTDDIIEISKSIAECKEFGVLTGIPSLKREEDSNSFVQGLERLIRAMRGKRYDWISIADPIPQDFVRNAISSCQTLQADIHHLVHTQLSKATSKGKTITLGGFGMMGRGTTDGTAQTDNTSFTNSSSKTHTLSQSTTNTHTDSQSTTNTHTDSQSVTNTHTDSQSTTNTHTDSRSTSTSHTDSYSSATTHTQNKYEGYQRAAKATSSVLGVAGGIIGSFICPGLGTLIGAGLGSAVGGAVEGIGAAITGNSGYSDGTSTSYGSSDGYSNSYGSSDSLARTFGSSDSVGRTTGSSDSLARTFGSSDSIARTSGTSDSYMEGLSNTSGFADTVSRAVAHQMAGGGFGSFGMTWTKTTTVGQELLNRKAEYAEETLKAYEDRLHEGTALGMWNLGHYFCAKDLDTYNRGIGIVTSLFAGMDSTYEPPRAIKVPENFKNVLRLFNNIYLRFSDVPITQDDLSGHLSFKDHPLGFLFNGPCTPVNTKELAIATPIATQDVEGVTVSERASFGINIPDENNRESSLTVGRILDKGNETSQRYRLKLDNLPKHLAVFGLTGSGKTNTIHHLLIQLWEKHHIPFLVIEPAKAEYRALSELEELKNELIVISAGVDQTAACPLRLNPFDFDPGRDNDANRVHILTHIDRLKATFNASFPMYASMPYILEEAILEIYRDRGWDLGRSVNRYIDIYKDDFHEYIPTLNDLYLKIDAIVQRKGYFQEQQMNIQAALKSRLSSLMVGAKGTMLNCRTSIPAADLFNRPAIIELENIGDDDEKAFLMGLLVSRLYEFRKASFSVNGEAGKQPFNHVLVIEEAHRLLANIPDTSSNMETANVKGKSVATFVDMLSEIRAMGQSVFVVDQLPSRVSPNIIKGTGAKIIHRLLAKDDRESVGWTMGLNDNQINDLCLLKTGECVVSQDGDRKSFMCHVPKNELHENRTGGEISKATLEYKEKIKALLLPAESIDREDIRFRDDLYATMLSIGAGESEDLLQVCCPVKHVGDAAKQKNAQQIYWKHICQEIWSFYEGDFKAFLNLQQQGMKLIFDPASVKDFRQAFIAFYKETPDYLMAQEDNVLGCAYKQLFLRKKILVSVNQNYDSVKHCPDAMTRLARSIAKVLPLLLPKNVKTSSSLAQTLTQLIVHSISQEINADAIWQSVLQQDWR